MRVRDVMSPHVITLRPAMTLSEAADLLRQGSLDGAAVVDGENRLIGIVTKTHFVREMAYGPTPNRTIGEIMTTDVYTLQESETISRLQQNSNIFRFGLFPVVNHQNQPVGYLTRTELIKYLSDHSLYLAEELKAVLNSAYNGIVVTNAEGVITLFNPAAEAITGLDASKVVGQMAEQVIPNTGMQRVLETGVMEVNQQQTIQNSHILSNRSPIFKDNKLLGAVAIFQDITELQAVADELETVKKLKSTLESILESGFECVVVVDTQGKITMLNQAYCDFLGKDSKQVIGMHVADVIENTRMHIVAQSGKAEIAAMQRIGDNNVVVTRMPIIKDGEIVGAVGKVLFRDVKDLKSLVRKFNNLQSELEYYKEELRKVQGGKHTFESIIGGSEKIAWLKAIGAKAAKGSSTVLILGESGTGKELFAHAIHTNSPRRNEPFIKVNCAAVPENLLESELFGYDDGAFTGARKGGKPGKFELANGGTIFLDEIGDMTLSMQAKLLRVLQEREIERVGSTKTLKIDVRVVAATNCDLEQMIEQGEFRQDLYYRLNIISLHIPPLRERREDIPQLCISLLQKINNRTPHDVEGVSPDAMNYLLGYDWPGNVRELENVLERAVNFMDDDQFILPEHLPPVIKKQYRQRETTDSVKDLAGIRFDAEKQAIVKAIEAAGGNKSQAAKILGIHRSGFYQKLRKYHIDP
ncbi:Fis family transcriptional regulator [Anaerosporomusa subterranea]|uniref:Fis family transcriptional regulator n=1 Tax=Anaerosporomusa subterranea TaxID=1794912 RepID=A0A154BTZ3_ANASB|nr:sigma 54-interacting transcriptional regulator [Anaerosporomusa subterranea]KYZ76988.1 Fis family transcriptional regulator [Anaerosporomusa subterranea]